MFKNPFSFEGRIRRLEYGLSYIIYLGLAIIGSMLLEIHETLDSVILLFYLLLWWFLLAQGAKRCHDLDNSGFYQLIPFYVLIMIFQDGHEKSNEYGPNPKSTEYQEIPSKRLPLRLKAVSHKHVLEIIAISLLTTFILGWNNIIFQDYENYIIASYFVMPIPAFFLIQLVNINTRTEPTNNAYKNTLRFYFALIYYLCIRMYTLLFRASEFEWSTFFIEVFATLCIFAIAYFAVPLYSLLAKYKLKHA